MEPPWGAGARLWNFICFLPVFAGLLLLGLIKGVVLCPAVCLIVAVGNTSIILGFWPVHAFWTCYCLLRAKHFGPVLKLVLLICAPIVYVCWPVIGIVGSILCGAAYGLLSPIFATFDAVGSGKSNRIFRCFYDGTWSIVKGSFTAVRDFLDVCYHSYFSYMDELQHQDPSQYYEIRILHLPGALLAGILGFLVDMPIVSLIALFKSPYMLFKGWKRLFHDLIGREGPFLETICVPFAGLAILLWPLAVVGAILGSIVSSVFLGAYAGVVAYQESSLWLGLCYVVASLSIYDEYSSDILDMPEGSCFPRPQYRRKKAILLKIPSRAISLSKPSSFKGPPARTGSINLLRELKPLELLDSLFNDCERHGERMASEGLINTEDIMEAKSKRGGGVISIGLPAYCLLQSLLRSARENSAGLLLAEGEAELMSTDRASDVFFDWFLNPLLILKEQIRAENLVVAEEDYLCKLVLYGGDAERLKRSFVGCPPEPELRRAELDGLARRLRGITRSISRYPTSRRRFETLVKILSDNLAKKSIRSQSISSNGRILKSKSALPRIFSQRSLKGERGNDEFEQDAQPVVRQEGVVDIL
ncbi:hypothetical protein MLD38_033664 [Melastoma candidum]|uniref:Uncharacterized protein n=1 Tax=Melastoma candidum TaxID=119954 RepID=A0ACB9M7A3_9MYRT|nr:hypothetical protein MLD38_033664 [Melastoma candidum]